MDKIPNMGVREADMFNLLDTIGLPMENENFRSTPIRWLRYIESYFQQYDPEEDLSAAYDEKRKGTYDHSMVVQVGIPYRAVCAHHLLPVLGTAHVGYIPHAKVVGLSKLTRVVQGITHSLPSLQEHVCAEVVDALMEHLDPLGAMCVIRAEHGCMAARGVQEAGIETVTSSVRGVFIDKLECRDEFYRIIGG